MRHLFVIAAAIVAAVAGPAFAQTPEQQRQLDWVVERGQLLFALDRAAWVATDDMQERVPRAQQQDVRGFIVDRDGRDHVVIFFALEGEQAVALYRGRVGANGVASRETFARGQRPALSPTQQRLARVRAQLAAAAPNLAMCSRSSANLAIVPPATPDGPIDLYVMTPQTDLNTLPFGGHHRLTLDNAGRITAQRAFTNGCLNMTKPPAGENQPVGLMVTHLLDPIPTEIHVFSALAAQMPVYVGTRESVWEVTGERIRFVSRMAD
jgi:hypothetical protein